MKHIFSIPSAHVLIHVNTHKLTIHTCCIHNDITKHNQPNVTVINVRIRIRIRMILFRKYKCKWCNKNELKYIM